MTADVEQLHAIAQGLPNLNGTGDLPEVKVQFRTGEDVYKAAPETPDWLWHGYIAAGATTLFSGSQKSGKSTFLFALMRAFLDGHTRFVGHDVRSGRVSSSPKKATEPSAPNSNTSHQPAGASSGSSAGTTLP